jgi:hypothetical protein
MSLEKQQDMRPRTNRNETRFGSLPKLNLFPTFAGLGIFADNLILL